MNLANSVDYTSANQDKSLEWDENLAKIKWEYRFKYLVIMQTICNKQL